MRAPAYTDETRSVSSSTKKSAFLPGAILPFLASTRMICAGVKLIMRTASVSGISACSTAVRTSLSSVATEPANALRSHSFATPSSMITGIPLCGFPRNDSRHLFAGAAHRIAAEADALHTQQCIDHPDKLRRKMAAVGDDLRSQLRQTKCALQYARIAEAVFPRDRRHRGIQVRYVAKPMFRRLFDLRIHSVGMSDRHKHPQSVQLIAQFQCAVQLRCDRPACDRTGIFLHKGSYSALRGGRINASLIAPFLLRIQIRSLQMNAGCGDPLFTEPAFDAQKRLDGRIQLLIGRSKQRRIDCGGSVLQMRAARCKERFLRPVHKIRAARTMGMDLHKARTQVLTMHVYTLGAAVRFPAPHGCYYSVFRLYTAVDDRFRQHNARIFKKEPSQIIPLPAGVFQNPHQDIHKHGHDCEE